MQLNIRNFKAHFLQNIPNLGDYPHHFALTSFALSFQITGGLNGNLVRVRFCLDEFRKLTIVSYFIKQ